MRSSKVAKVVKLTFEWDSFGGGGGGGCCIFVC